MAAADLPRLMLVTDRHATGGRDLVDVVADACRAGLRFVHVRERDLPLRAVRQILFDVRDVVPEGTLIVLNGRPELALEAGVGVHLAAAAPLPAPAERPPLWGRAIHEAEEAAQAARDGARYVSAGTIFPTPAKPGFAGKGTEFLARVVKAAGALPVYAVGGMDTAHAGEARRAGAYGVAVRRAILEAPRPGDVVRKLLQALEG